MSTVASCVVLSYFLLLKRLSLLASRSEQSGLSPSGGDQAYSSNFVETAQLFRDHEAGTTASPFS